MPNLIVRPPDRRALVVHQRLKKTGPKALKNVIFLAGPIKGGGAWQEKAIEILGNLKDTGLIIASPRRLTAYQEKFSDKDFEEQALWEFDHLRFAAESGVILFWFPVEDSTQHDCKRAYAQTTRVEIGEWMERHKWNEAKVVVGFEAGVSGERYLRFRIGTECPAIPLCSSLEETCQKAFELLMKK